MGTIGISYGNESYVCYFFAAQPGIPKEIYIKNAVSGKNIYLNPMASGGAYYMINDRTYLHQETGKRLLEALGCTVEICPKTKIVTVYRQGD